MPKLEQGLQGQCGAKTLRVTEHLFARKDKVAAKLPGLVSVLWGRRQRAVQAPLQLAHSEMKNMIQTQRKRAQGKEDRKWAEDMTTSPN